MTDRWKSTKDGEEKTSTTWLKIVCWGSLAETVSKIIGIGDLVYVTGKITTRTYEKDGQTIKVTEIKADDVIRIQSKENKTTIDDSE